MPTYPPELPDIDLIDDPDLLEHILYGEDPTWQPEQQLKDDGHSNDDEVINEEIAITKECEEKDEQDTDVSLSSSSPSLDSTPITQTPLHCQGDIPPSTIPTTLQTQKISIPSSTTIPSQIPLSSQIQLSSSSSLPSSSSQNPTNCGRPLYTETMATPLVFIDLSTTTQTLPIDTQSSSPSSLSQTNRRPIQDQMIFDPSSLIGPRQLHHLPTPPPPIHRHHHYHHLPQFTPLLTQNSGLVKTIQSCTKNGTIGFKEMDSQDLDLLQEANIQYLLQISSYRGVQRRPMENTNPNEPPSEPQERIGEWQVKGLL